MEGTSVFEFLDLGLQPISNSFPAIPNSGPAYRLAVVLEVDTGLVRLSEQPAPDQMFHSEYAFKTRTSRRMVDHFADTARDLLALSNSKAPRVVEIGSNDGAFLEQCRKLGATVLGIDPSSGVNEIARDHGVDVWEGFFSMEEARRVREMHPPFDVAYAANALCHIPDFAGNLSGFAELLCASGVLVFEDPYLGAVMKHGTYDQFYDEHYYMFSATAVNRVAKQTGLHLFDAVALNTHGGSMRYFLAKNPRAVTSRLNAILAWESLVGVESQRLLGAFSQRVAASSAFLRSQLAELARLSVPVIGLGAASKAVTVLNYCDLDASLIQSFSDSTPSKVGRYMAGTDIPVQAQDLLPSGIEFVGFLGAHNHEAEILDNLKARGISPRGILSAVPFSTVR